VTQDKDFGELAFRKKLPAACGIILFRLSGKSAASDINRMLEIIASREDWEGHFSVVTETKIRMRGLSNR
jgi:hypothetical protein